MAYYTSLPSSKRFTGEISGIVDAIIKTFEDELSNCEDKDDVKFKLCHLLKAHYDLLVENYDKYEDLNGGLSFRENPIQEIISRKIKNVIESTPEPSDYKEILEQIKQSLK